MRVGGGWGEGGVGREWYAFGEMIDRPEIPQIISLSDTSGSFNEKITAEQRQRRAEKQRLNVI